MSARLRALPAERSSTTSSRSSRRRRSRRPSSGRSPRSRTRARRLAFRARALERQARPRRRRSGRIVIPTIGVSDVFVEGTGAGDLRKGPGHYPATPLPGERGTVAIAGHRTTYGAPFRQHRQARPRRPDRAADAVRALHLPGRAHADRAADRDCRSPTASTTTGSCSPPAIRSTRRPSGSSCSPRLVARGAAMRRIRVLTPSSVRRSVTTYVHMTVLAVRYETGTRTPVRTK